ncbi:MAG: hypothetical protein H6560_09465 [Lewinellaceae bacterium]|nr:hypothetical protein [Lewinellaceae bacterium]
MDWRKNIIPFLLLFILASCTTRKITLDEKVYPGTFDPVLNPQPLFIQHESHQKRQILGGNYRLGGDTTGFKLCVEDRNRNGKFMEPGIDAIGITYTGDTTVVISSMLNGEAFFGTAALLKEKMVFRFEDAAFQITGTNEAKKQISFRRAGTGSTRPDFQLTSRLPDFEFTDLFSGEKRNLLEGLSPHKDYYLIVFWSTFCPPCIEEFPLLKQLSEKEVEVVNICGMCDIPDAQKVVLEHEVPGIHAVSNAYIESIFHQNGYPFAILYDSSLKRIGRMFPPEAALDIVAEE